MAMDLLFETETQEFKKTLSELDKGIITISAMLNKRGRGKVLFGVDDYGKIVGVELGKETIKKISSRFAEGIKPATIPKISIENYDNKIVIVLEAEGGRRPYSAFGEYRIRSGSENKKIDPEELGELFFTNSSLVADNVESINQNLTFNQLKSLYLINNLSISNDTFEKNTGLLTNNGKYNYIAEILSDSNNCSIKVVKFRGINKLNMISRNEFGYQCMILAMKQVYEYVASMNETRVNLDEGMQRTETSLFSMKCFDEAWTNACLHNRWVRNIPPAVYIFDDRIEIISAGGLPIDFSEEEFFAGISHPINATLQKIMGQLGIVEQTGHGVPTILAEYGRNAFEITDNHICVTIPFAFTPSAKTVEFFNLTPSQGKILQIIKDNPLFTINEISQASGLGKSQIANIISDLKRLNRLQRVGGRKGGYWKVL